MADVTKWIVYTITNLLTPTFLTSDKAPVAPDSEAVRRMPAKAPVLRLTGTITAKSGSGTSKTLGTPSIVIDAAHYRFGYDNPENGSDARSSITVSGNTATVRIPSFRKGKVSKPKKLDTSAASYAFFAKPTVAPEPATPKRS